MCRSTAFRISVHADDKIEQLQGYLKARYRRKQCSDLLSDTEMASLRSLCSSIGWIGVADSPFCAIYASHLQQKVLVCRVSDLTWQLNAIGHLQRLESTIQFVRLTEKKSTLGCRFSDACREENYGQLEASGDVLIGGLKKGSAFHALSWSLQKPSRPIKSVGAAEILGSGEATDDGKVLVKAYETLLRLGTDWGAIVDSKDLYNTFTACRKSTDRSVRADGSVITYEFETGKVISMISIPENLNIADAIIKPSNSTAEMLQLAVYFRKTPDDFNQSPSLQSKKSTG